MSAGRDHGRQRVSDLYGDSERLRAAERGRKREGSKWHEERVREREREKGKE